jgi:modulator of FtsH protease HflC
MRIFLWIGGLAALGALVVAAVSSYFTVDQTEFVYVTQFGQHVATFDGAADAGWHWKLPWPVQSVQRLDHRLQVFDLPDTELLTRDPKGTIDKTLTIGAYVCWRIADKDGVDQFIRTVGDPARARVILGQRVSSRLGAELGTMPIEDLVGVAGEAQVEARTHRLRDRLLGGGTADNLKDLARQAYGIEVVDIRLRRFNHPPAVRGAIYDRIRSERSKKAREYESDGAKRARDIGSLADREARDIQTEARSHADRLRKEADVKADEIRNQAHSKDREFYTFLQKLKTYQSMLGDTKDVLLLSSKHELFDMLLKPPRPNGEPAPAPKTGGGQ